MASHEISFEEAFRRVGAFWKHDGNPRRPYARLTSGKISDGFFNADRVTRKASLLNRAVGHLMRHEALIRALDAIGPRNDLGLAGPTTLSHPPMIVTQEPTRKIGRIVGAAYGGILLAHSAAHHVGCDSAFAIKIDILEEGAMKVGERLVLDRFKQDFNEGELVLLVEDTVSTGDTLLALRDEVLRISPKARVLPCAIALCNRSSQEVIGGIRIASLISPSMRIWDEGDNPFTGGPELVKPLRPKGENWKLLTQPYD